MSDELRLLKCLLSDLSLALDFSLHHSNYIVGDFRELTQNIIDYVKEYKTLPTDRIIITKFPEDTQNDIKEALTTIHAIEHSSSEYQFLVNQLKNKYISEQYYHLKESLYEEEDPIVALERLDREISSLKQLRSGKKIYTQKTVKQYLTEFKNTYVARLKDPGSGQGILTGYSHLDYITNGIKPSELVIIGAESGVGKSILLSNIATQMWMQKNTITTDTTKLTKGCNILYFSLEMPYESCFRRFMARLADVPIYSLRDASLTRSEADAVSQAGKFIARYPYEFEIVDIPTGATIEHIEEKFLEARSRFNPDVVVVDYIGLMEEKSDREDWLKLGHIAEKLHEFGRMYNIRVLTAAQLNRLAASKKNPEKGDIIGLHRFGRSNMIAHNADLCLQIESRPDERLRGDMAVHIIKYRDGTLGNFSLQKKLSNGAIFDIPYIPPEKDEYGMLISGFEDEADISAAVAEILGIKKHE